MTAPARDAGGRHERRVARRLEARGSPGQAEALCRLHGAVIGGRWRIDTLYAAGAEGAVFLVSDLQDPPGMRCVAKIPLLPYHRPGEISASGVRKRREALREEAAYLALSASPHMPCSQGLHELRNPLLDPARGGVFAEPERALVMEWISGLDVDLWLARVHHSRVSRELLRRHMDHVALVLLEALYDLQERGFLYTDLRPGNLRMIGGPLRRVRLLDAGSLVAATDRTGKFPHVPHYLPPALFEQRYGRGIDIVPTPAVQAVMAGRTLYEIATGTIPIPGQPLRTDAYRDCAVSPLVADIVDGLATGSFQNVVYALRYLTRQRAHGKVGGAPASARTAAAPTAPSASAAPATTVRPARIPPTAAVAPKVPAAPAPTPAPVPVRARAPAAAAPPVLAPLELEPAAVMPVSTVRTPVRAAPPRQPVHSDAQYAGRPPSAARLRSSRPHGVWSRLGRALRALLGG